MSNHDGDGDAARVLALLDQKAKVELEAATNTSHRALDAIARAEDLLRRRGALPDVVSTPPHVPPDPATPRSLRLWQELVAEAEVAFPEPMDLAVLLSPSELAAINQRLQNWEEEAIAPHRLQAFDYWVAGVAGLMAGLADVFLVQVPAHPGFLGGVASGGGWLSSVVEEGFSDLLPPETISALEREYKVPFDAATNSGLSEAVAGLGPRSHRLSSLGHDPFLGWIFGVRDILAGGFTAIGKDGRLVTQTVPGYEPVELGINIFSGVWDAFRSLGGHLASDVATPAGLPPPFFSLLQFIQSGDIAGRSVSELCRAMYGAGYDFRHFVAGSIPVMVAEIIVRVSWTVRELNEGKDFKDALPLSNKPRLRTGLFVAHSVAAAVNAGKVAVTQNPLSISWAQWLTFFRYLVPQLNWAVIGKDRCRGEYVDRKLDDQWREIEAAFEADLERAGVQFRL